MKSTKKVFSRKVKGGKIRFVGVLNFLKVGRSPVIKSFGQAFSKACGVERRSLSSPVATGEISYDSQNAGG